MICGSNFQSWSYWVFRPGLIAAQCLYPWPERIFPVKIISTRAFCYAGWLIPRFPDILAAVVAANFDRRQILTPRRFKQIQKQLDVSNAHLALILDVTMRLF